LWSVNSNSAGNLNKLITSINLIILITWKLPSGGNSQIIEKELPDLRYGSSLRLKLLEEPSNISEELH
jgi:hypothetical protein